MAIILGAVLRTVEILNAVFSCDIKRFHPYTN